MRTTSRALPTLTSNHRHGRDELSLAASPPPIQIQGQRKSTLPEWQKSRTTLLPRSSIPCRTMKAIKQEGHLHLPRKK